MSLCLIQVHLSLLQNCPCVDIYPCVDCDSRKDSNKATAMQPNMAKKNQIPDAIIWKSLHKLVHHFRLREKEAPCSISMREYVSKVQKPLVDITKPNYENLLNPDPNKYKESQDFAVQLHENNEWGIYYPSVRKNRAKCVAIFRPPALTIPTQGCHLQYIWDGAKISDINKISKISKISN